MEINYRHLQIIYGIMIIIKELQILLWCQCLLWYLKCLIHSMCRGPLEAKIIRWLTNWRKVYIHFIFLWSFITWIRKVELVYLVNKANLVHNLLLVYLSISTCFGRLCAHHQEKQVCLCDTWYLLFVVDDCLVCRVEYQTVIHTE